MTMFYVAEPGGFTVAKNFITKLIKVPPSGAGGILYVLLLAIVTTNAANKHENIIKL